MSLLSYQEARPWAKSIAKAVTNRDMPPWSGNSDRHVWANDISLTDAQIETVATWVSQGAVEGDPADLPEVPTFADGWTLGEPDYVLELDRVDVAAGGEDIFPVQIKEILLDEPRWVRAIEVLPGDRRVTHHFQSTYRSTTTEGKSEGLSRDSSGIFVIWTAGMPPYVFPEGMGRRLGAKTTVRLDLHYHPMGEAASDTSKIGLFFGKGELKKQVATIPVTNTGLRIPPGADHHAENAHYLFDKDMQILAFSPHMHVRGKAMSYQLTYPDGTREMLLDVPKYNYNWQWLYYPTKPIDIPAGSRLDVTAVWNNSESNPANPDPSKEVIYRGDTVSEMFNGFIEVIQKDGVAFETPDARQKLLDLLAFHPKENSFLVDGFLKLAFHVPRQGEGWLYMGDIFSISLDDYAWNGNQLKITTQFPTQQASATTTVIEGAIGDDGRFEGALEIGSDTENPRKLPIVGVPYAEIMARGKAGPLADL